MEKPVLPEFPADGAEGVAKSQGPLGVPGGTPRIEATAFGEVVGPEGDEGEQRQQGRHGAGDGLHWRSTPRWRRAWGPSAPPPSPLSPAPPPPPHHSRA